jgi:hypothetical protein
MAQNNPALMLSIGAMLHHGQTVNFKKEQKLQRKLK